MNRTCQNPFSNTRYEQKSVVDILQQNDFSFSAEIIPPRNGVDFKEVFDKIQILKQGKFDFISVTHGAGGSLRGGTLPIAYHAQEVCQMTAIAHLTCRGMTSEEMENSLIDHHYFGIHNILALRGDPPDGIDLPFVNKEGGYQYAYQLVEALQKLNTGRYTKRKNFDNGSFRKGLSTRFCVGVAVYPEKNEFEFLKLKREKGADFGISQMIFDADVFIDFWQQVQKEWENNFPVLPGIWIPTNFSQLTRMGEKFGVKVPQELMEQMREAEKISPQAMEQVGKNWAFDFIKKIQEQGVPGVHFFIMGNPQSAVELKQRFAENTGL